MIHIVQYSGAALRPYLPDLAQLRIRVFREYPYLYDGDLAYEEKYLDTYAAAPDSVMILALDADKVVGALTGVPLVSETSEVMAPFLATGYDPQHVFYYGEALLLPEYRGKGLGVQSFDALETHVRSLARFTWAAFCVVERPTDHPCRPAQYQPLDTFWQQRGFTQHVELRTTFSWQEVGEACESPKPMVFWLKRLA